MTTSKGSVRVTGDDADDEQESSRPAAGTGGATDHSHRPDVVVLSVEDLRAGYGTAVVLEGVSFDVREGETVGVVGPNGAGKTTLLRSLSRLHDSEGEVTLDGEPLSTSATKVVGAGLVQCPERRRLFPNLTVEENLRMGAYRLGRKGATDEDFDRVYDMFPRLKERTTQKAGTMSGGEQQQCAIARALMARPRLLLLDEPTLGLSVGVKETIIGSVQAVKDSGVTMLLVEQDVGFAVRASDQLVVLENGTVTREGPADEVAADPRVREAYLGVA